MSTDHSAFLPHLSWDEDMAYTRLLRAYLPRKKPIPMDIKEACRLVRASTPAHRKAVESVLNEFFERGAEGWRQKDRDVEIKQPRAKRRTVETFLPDDFELDPELKQYVLRTLPDCDVMAWFEDWKITARSKQWRYADWRLAVMSSARKSRKGSGHWLEGQYPKVVSLATSPLFRDAI